MTEQLMHFLQTGVEWVLWVLIAMSVVCVAILIERTIVLSRKSWGRATLKTQLLRFLGRDDWDAAQKFFAQQRSLPAMLIHEALLERERSPEALQEIHESRGIEERQKLERGLSFLGTVGANAPFIGLFGTVLGIIKAFHDLAISKQAGPSVVMAGISEALVATAVGLLVAIPAVIFFNIFKSWAHRIMKDTDSLFKLFLAHRIDEMLRYSAPKTLQGTQAKIECKSFDESEGMQLDVPEWLPDNPSKDGYDFLLDRDNSYIRRQ